MDVSCGVALEDFDFDEKIVRVRRQIKRLGMVTSAIGFVTIAATVLSGAVASILGPGFHVEIAGFTLHRYDTIYLVSGMSVLAAGVYARLALATRAHHASPATADDHVAAGAES